MKCRHLGWSAIVAIGIGATAFAQSPSALEEAALIRQADTIKPTPAELRWQQLPWELDLQEAIRLAKKERRPIFLWTAGGRDRDGVPLERC
jgi:hypothetical protein